MRKLSLYALQASAEAVASKDSLFSIYDRAKKSRVSMLKYLKLSHLSLIALFVSASISVSCSNDNHATTDESSAKSAETFLKSFYIQNSELGKSVEMKPSSNSNALYRGTELQNYVITEVFVGEDTRARGYLITEKSSSDFVFFLDVNRIDYKLTGVKIETNEARYFNEINELDKYAISDEFDFIKLTEDPDFLEPIVTDPDPVAFKVKYSYGSCVNGVRGVYKATYFLGIRISKLTPVMVENEAGTGLVNATVGCDEEFTP